jgi:hypothetical protein
MWLRPRAVRPGSIIASPPYGGGLCARCVMTSEMVGASMFIAGLVVQVGVKRCCARLWAAYNRVEAVMGRC